MDPELFKLVRFAHNRNVGLRLVEPTPRREYWNDGIMDDLVLRNGKEEDGRLIYLAKAGLNRVLYGKFNPAKNGIFDIPLFHIRCRNIRSRKTSLI
jgi:hypothetical protein